MHINQELADDVLKTVKLVAVIAAAAYGARNHGKIKEINKAVNGVIDPSEPTLRENVLAIKDEQKAVKATLEQTPKPGQAGG